MKREKSIMAEYKDVIVTAASGGFGGPLKLHPDAKQNKIVNITGGVISPVAKRLAEMTGCELVDGFKTSVPDDEILAVVIDCGGTLRCGIYPQKSRQQIQRHRAASAAATTTRRRRSRSSRPASWRRSGSSWAASSPSSTKPAARPSTR